ncbi:MAG: hypothetical protein QXU18_07375 [Thermoplasmatales archaeon]
MTESKKLKVQRPNSLKIAIIILLFYAESYDDERRLDKTWLYRILKAHYGLKNSKNIKNQIEMLKAAKIIAEDGNTLRAVISPDFMFRVYNIIQEAPEDIFPLYQREIDFFHYVIKTANDAKLVWREVINKQHPNPGENEPKYDRAELFYFLFYFSLVDRVLTPVALQWFAMRYLARLIYEDLRRGENFTWDYPEIQELKSRVTRSIHEGYDYESVFALLNAATTPELCEKITLTCFPPFKGEVGQIPYVLILGASLSAQLFFFNISATDISFWQIVQPAGPILHTGMYFWLHSIAMRDGMIGKLRRFSCEGYEFNILEFQLMSMIRLPSYF